MSAQTDYSFNGIGTVEAQDRVNEHRTGVPGIGAPALLQRAPVKRLSKIAANNVGKEAAYLRLKHGGKTQTRTAESLKIASQGSQVYTGSFQFKNIVPGTVSITNGGAPLTIVDDSAGNLVDTGTTTKRGTVNYATGAFTFTYGAAETLPVLAAYSHTDYVEFASAAQVITDAGGANPRTITCPFGRVVPGSVVLADGVHTWADDGKGNIVQTDTGYTVVGTIDYATGIITKTSGTAIGASTASSCKFNPFAALIVAGGGQKLFDVQSAIPELTNEAFADGVKGETYVGLFGDSHAAAGAGTSLIVQWAHYGEEPWRVDDVFSGFPAGGYSNDPSIDQSVAHL